MESDEVGEIRKQALEKEGFYNLQVFLSYQSPNIALPCRNSLNWIVSHLPGGHLPPPKFGHLPPPNSDISHPRKKTFARRTTATPIFFFFLAHFSWLF